MAKKLEIASKMHKTRKELGMKSEAQIRKEQFGGRPYAKHNTVTGEVLHKYHDKFGKKQRGD